MTTTFTADELATIKLMVEFNKAVLEKFGELSHDLALKDQAAATRARAEVGAMSDDDLDAALKNMMEQNPGTSKAAACGQLVGAPKEQKADFLVNCMVRAEMAKLPRLEPAKVVSAQMNIDIDAMHAKIRVIDQKYGREVLQAEVDKLRGLAPQ